MDSRFSTRVMKENKATVQEIRKTSFLYPKTSKEFYHSEKYNEQKVFHKKAVLVLKNFAIFTGKHLYLILFFDKNAGHQACSFIKKRLQYRCFHANIQKFLRTPIQKNICERLLLRVFLEQFLQEQIAQEVKKTFSQKQNKTKTGLKLSYNI